ncbi:FAS1 domain-containing protein [Hyaloscypha sp. PMI_1271]|nr:FAS1 domain-containing protein [Hyaloscypha sp. PMI_1271]
MELLLFCLLLFISRVRSQALLSVLQNHFELSTFNSYVNGSQKLTNLLSSADNVTLLAPSNAAFKAWLPKQAPNLAEDQIEALLTYHLVHGVFPSVTFSDQPQFSKTFLNNITYTNVTGGQRAELSTGSSGNPEIVSGNKSVSGILTTDILFTGGLIQIIDTVLTIPLNFVILITQANFKYFVALLNAGGYLSPNATPLVSNAIDAPSNTIFAPNTQAAVDSFNSISATMSQEKLAEIFNYHTVPGFLGYSTQLKHGMQLRTLQGTNLTITVQGNNTFVNGARIMTYDYLVYNGVVHMIDSFLNPSNTTGPPPPTETQTPPATTSSSTPASKAGIGIGVVLIAVALAGAMYFLLKWIKKRKLVGVEKRERSKVVWNAGPVWTRKVTKQMGRERGVSPQELDAEQKPGMDVESSGVSEASTMAMGSRYEGSTVGSWGGELEGSGGPKMVVRGHLSDVAGGGGS